jgi:hypothetical protein
VFIATTVITVLFFFIAANKSKTFLAIVIVWLALQTILSLKGFYTTTNTAPPRFALLAVPPLLLIILAFATKRGRRFIDSLNVKTLTWLHTIRIAVEFTLLWLALNKAVPQLMTFEGRNFDIISGISAPFIAYFGFTKNKMERKTLLAWNFICLALLLNIVINAILSVPSTFQQLAFDQPNIAVLHFPFVWLPCCIVPIVLFAHLASIKHLLDKNKFYGKLNVTVLNRNKGVQVSDTRKAE